MPEEGLPPLFFLEISDLDGRVWSILVSRFFSVWPDIRRYSPFSPLP